MSAGTVALAIAMNCAAAQAVDLNDGAAPEQTPPAAVTAISADAPGTDIYHVRVGGIDEYVTLSPARNLTPRAGYDNQPVFEADGSSILYTAIHEGQADIYRLSLAPGATPQRLTRTVQTSEYSPTPIRGGGGISTVRVETDGAQRLWRLSQVGTDVTVITPQVRNVGYHAWLDERQLLLYLVGEPSSLARLTRGDRYHASDRPSARPIVIDQMVGRTLARDSQTGKAVYMHGDVAGGTGELRRYDPATGEISTWGPVLPGESEFFALHPSGAAFIVRDRTVYRLAPAATRWLAVGYLVGVEGGAVTRLAISPAGDQLAVVVEEAAAAEVGD